MNPDAYRRLEVADIAELTRKGLVSGGDILDAALEVLAAENPKYNAVISVYADLAHRQVEAGLPNGPLCGVPVILKDLSTAWAETRTTFGSALFRAVTPWQADCALVRRLKDAGAVILGRSNCAEFGLGLWTEPEAYGPTRNPRAPQRSAGGSSGGAAAAVASGMTPLALGTDGCGSLRVPASHCGVFALKPSRGRISFAPEAGESWAGMTSHGALTRCVRSTALFLDAACGPEPGDPYIAAPSATSFVNAAASPPRKLHIGILDHGPHSACQVDPDCAQAVHAAASLCSHHGHEVEVRHATLDVEALIPHLAVLWGTQLWLLVEPQYRETGRAADGSGMEISSWQLARAGRSFAADDHLGAIRYLHQAARQFARDMHGLDVLLTPVAASPAEKLGSHRNDVTAEEHIRHLLRDFPFTIWANMAGAPAMSAPLWRTREGLPVGVQAIASPGNDALLISLAAQWEASSAWQRGESGR
jgi:Asp-tRNA(Asn)/Glu-tRNA(Gln) amidotransferase A subunit family amidase